MTDVQIKRTYLVTLALAFMCLFAGPRLAVAQVNHGKKDLATPVKSQPTIDNLPKTGTLKGRFRYMGRPPEPKQAQVNVDAGLLGQYKIVDQSLVTSDERGVANIFVWVRSNDIPVPLAKKLEPVTVEFKEGQFFPHALAFQAPCDLTGVVHESVAVNFFYQGEASLFNVLCPAHDEVSQPVKPELVPARLVDNIHPWAKAWMLPLRHPFCAVSDKNGYFKIENLPPGKWEFQVWHERTGNLQTKDWPSGRFTMEIRSGENDLGEIKLPPALFRDAARTDEP